MILTLEQLILNIDDVTIVKGDYDINERKESQFKLFEPKTWFLDPEITKKNQWYVQIWYHKNNQLCNFKYLCIDSKRASEIISDLATQMKMQLNATNQEVLDKVFEKAIMEAK